MPDNNPLGKLPICSIESPTSPQELSSSSTFEAKGGYTPSPGVLLKVWAKVFPGVQTDLPDHPWDPPATIGQPPTEGVVTNNGTRWSVPNLSGAAGSCEVQTFVVWYISEDSEIIGKQPTNFTSHMSGASCPEEEELQEKGIRGEQPQNGPVPRYYRISFPVDVPLPGSSYLDKMGLIQRASILLEFSDLSIYPFGRIWKCQTDTAAWMLVVPEVKPGDPTAAVMYCQPIARKLSPPFIWSVKHWQPMGVNRMVGASTGYGRPGEFALEVVRAD